jgi:hypothetical protein
MYSRKDQQRLWAYSEPRPQGAVGRIWASVELSFRWKDPFKEDPFK